MDKRKKILSGIGLVAAIIVGYFLYDHLTYVTTDNAQVEGHAVMLAPKVNGYVQTVSVVEGQKVAKGDVLLEIDARDYENTLKQVKGELASVEARKTDAEKNFQRLQDLFSKSVVSRQQFDASQASYSDVKAKFDSLSAQLAQAQLNLENTKIHAPSDGFIAKKSVEPGQLAGAGIPLLGFVSAEERWVTANFKETDLSDIHIGASANINVDAVPGKTFTGKVVSISSATGATFTLLPPDNATGNFTKVVQRVPVKIEFVGVDAKDIELLRAGLSADVKVHKH